MRILFLCNKSPYPPKEGGPMAMNANIEGLINNGHEVKVIALNTNKYYTDPKDIPTHYRNTTGIEFVHVDLSVKPVPAFFNLFSDKSYHVERFISGKLEDKIIEVLKKNKYDIVQLELLYMTPYIEVIRKYSDAKIILRSHNIEHLIWERIASTTSNRFKRLYISELARKLKKYELETINSYDGIATISNKDAEFFRENGCQIPLVEIPFGIDISSYEMGDQEFEFPSLFHLGAMNWVPNEEGMKWFLDNVWPKIHSKYPDLKFYIAGRMMPDWLTSLDIPNVEVLGEVPDAGKFIQSKAIMIVPLFSGSGIRIKIIEGMALGKAIISTGVGAEGILCKNGENILLADDPGEFLDAVDKFVTSKEFTKRTGDNARLLVEEKHDIEFVIDKLESFYNFVLKK